MNKSNRLNETDYEPGLRKKVQEHIVGANIPNGKTVMIQSEGIRVKEIYDYPSRSSSKKGKDQKSKEEASKKKDKSADIKRQGRMEEESRFSKKYSIVSTK